MGSCEVRPGGVALGGGSRGAECGGHTDRCEEGRPTPSGASPLCGEVGNGQALGPLCPWLLGREGARIQVCGKEVPDTYSVYHRWMSRAFYPAY